MVFGWTTACRNQEDDVNRAILRQWRAACTVEAIRVQFTDAEPSKVQVLGEVMHDQGLGVVASGSNYLLLERGQSRK
eukprot:scaffold212469_cov33-Tisochrysis_lutea.AAC.2